MTAYNVINAGSLISGQPEDVSVILANLQAIATVLNGNIDNANVNAAAALAISKLAGYPSDGAKVLKGDGTWATLASGGPTPVTSLPGSPTDALQAILTDSLTAPNYQWLCQYESSISDSYKWMVLGPTPIRAEALLDSLTNGYSTVATVTVPYTGYYSVRAFCWSGNGAVSPAPRVRVNGSVQRTMSPAGGQYTRSMAFLYEPAALFNLTAGQTVDVQANANGTDSTYSQGSVAITPIRLA